MALVSALYRLAPSNGYSSPVEDQKRIERAIARLVRQYGGTEVRRRIRESSGPDDLKARLILLALTAD
jgi:hypothetical protein